MCKPLKTISFFVSPLYIRESSKAFKFKSRELRLRDFQYEIYERLTDPDRLEIIRVHAPTGSGKTLSLLIPLLVNLENGWAYSGSIGIYPSRELAEDQMVTLYNLLIELGTEPGDVDELFSEAGPFPELSGLPEEEKKKISEPIKMLVLETADGKRIPILLLLITSGTLHGLRKALEKLLEATKGNPSGGNHVSHRDLLHRIATWSDGRAYIIVFTVPEYPYLMSTGTYRSFDEAGVQLEAMLRELRRLLKALESSSEEQQVEWLRRVVTNIDRRRLYKSYYVGRELLGELGEIFLHIFRAVAFFDEFHLYSGFSLASFISLLYIYMCERGVGKIIISSATPDKPIRVKQRDKDLFGLIESLAKVLGYEVYSVTAEASSNPGNGWMQIRKRTEVRVVPVVLMTSVTGAPAYGVLQRCLPDVLSTRGWVEEYKRIGRSMILVDRVASVFEVADKVKELTGEEPLRVCSIKKLFQEAPEDRKTSLKEAKLIVGNMGVAFGIDIKGMDLGIVVAKDHLSAIQKIGRIGRGQDTGTALVYLPIPAYKYHDAMEVLEKVSSREISYVSTSGDLDFIQVLRRLYPSVSPDILVRSSVGVFKAVFPMWVYTFATIIRLRSEMREELYVARSIEGVRYLRWFVQALRVLGDFFEIDRLERRLRLFAKKRLNLTPLALYNLYSYRSVAGVVVKWKKLGGDTVEEVVDLVTAGRNIPLTYFDGEFWVDQGYRPYTYSQLIIAIDKHYADKARKILEELDMHVVKFGYFIEMLESVAPKIIRIGSVATLHQSKPGVGFSRIVGLAHLLENRSISELPVLVLHAKNDRAGRFIEHLSAVESAIQICIIDRDQPKLLGGVYLL